MGEQLFTSTMGSIIQKNKSLTILIQPISSLHQIINFILPPTKILQRHCSKKYKINGIVTQKTILHLLSILPFTPLRKNSTSLFQAILLLSFTQLKIRIPFFWKLSLQVLSTNIVRIRGYSLWIHWMEKF